MKYRCITPPYAEPIDLEAAKLQCKLLDSDNDADVAGKIAVAVADIEDLSGRQLVAATYELLLDWFPAGAIKLPRTPLVSVTSITYLDSAGVSRTLATSVYQVDPDAEPGEISLKYGQSWPSTYDQANAITIRFICGHATPFTVVAATDVLTVQGRAFVKDTAVRLLNSGGALPAGLSEMTDYYVLTVTGSTFKIALTQDGTAVDVTTVGEGTHFIVTGLKDFIKAQQAILLLVEDLFFHRDSNQAAIDRLINGIRATWL
jgi:uncharacterized phiE125 gp8 family phage protein